MFRGPDSLRCIDVFRGKKTQGGKEEETQPGFTSEASRGASICRSTSAASQAAQMDVSVLYSCSNHGRAQTCREKLIQCETHNVVPGHLCRNATHTASSVKESRDDIAPIDVQKENAECAQCDSGLDPRPLSLGRLLASLR